jgi:hypothetical protein
VIVVSSGCCRFHPPIVRVTAVASGVRAMVASKGQVGSLDTPGLDPVF